MSLELLNPDQRATLVGKFVQAEASIKAVITRAAATEEWRLAEDECANLEQILGLHDQQLGALPKHLIDAAKQRLLRVLAKGSFPSISA